MKRYLPLLLLVLLACNKEKDQEEKYMPQALSPVECDITVKACTPVPHDTVYLKWIDNSNSIKETYITSCLYIHTKFFTGDTIHFEYHALQNDMVFSIFVNQVLMFDTVFIYQTLGKYNYIVELPEK